MDIKERLEKAIENVAKAEKTLERHNAKLAKLMKELDKYSIKSLRDWKVVNATDEQYANYDLLCKINWCEDDIKKTLKKIAEKKEIVKGWEEKLAKVEAKAEAVSKIPAELQKLAKALVEDWDRYDKERMPIVLERKAEFDKAVRAYYQDKAKRYPQMFEYHINASEVDRYTNKTDEQRHEDNVRDAENIILDLMYRVKEKAGNIETWGNVYCTQGNAGVVLNGVVRGDKGTAVVESIGAGGYNIQRYHIRTLVK